MQPKRSNSCEEVVRLQQQVAELGERDAVLALEPAAHRLLLQHVVDGEVLAGVAQERQQVDRRQPVGVVDDARGIARGVEIEKPLELLRGCRRRSRRSARATAACAPATCRWDRRSSRCRRRRCDRRVAEPLQPRQRHHRQQMPTCRLDAVGSKPMYAVTALAAEQRRPALRSRRTPGRATSVRRYRLRHRRQSRFTISVDGDHAGARVAEGAASPTGVGARRPATGAYGFLYERHALGVTRADAAGRRLPPRWPACASD